MTTVATAVGEYRHGMDSVSDAEVIAQSIDNPEAFGEIFNRYHDTIYRFVARRAGRGPAPDLTAEVFGRAFRLRTRYDTFRPLARPWLYGIATNVIGDHIRQTRRRERLHLAMLGLTDVPADEDMDRLVDSVTAQGGRRVINDALARLSVGDRNVIVLAAVEQLTYKEISEALGIPIGTVRSRHARARGTLRELLGHLRQTTD